MQKSSLLDNGKYHHYKRKGYGHTGRDDRRWIELDVSIILHMAAEQLIPVHGAVGGWFLAADPRFVAVNNAYSHLPNNLRAC
jgi:hypothetical protein